MHSPGGMQPGWMQARIVDAAVDSILLQTRAVTLSAAGSDADTILLHRGEPGAFHRVIIGERPVATGKLIRCRVRSESAKQPVLFCWPGAFLRLFFHEWRLFTMEMTEKPIKPLYLKYLLSAFGSALVGAVYTLVDMAVIGQYAGPTGTAAIALVMPVWSFICSLGILTGIGGSVLYSNAKGQNGIRKANAMFTAAVIATTGITLIVWLLMIFFDRELLHLLGSEGELMEIGLEYLKPLKAAIPVFIFSQMLAAFLRNDNDPGLATFAVVFTSLLNIAGDYLLTFTLNMGVYGAALATVLCNLLSVAIMLAHFLKKKNTLRFVLPKRLLPTCGRIIAIGFSVFFVDLAMGIMTMLYNRRILQLLNNDALSVFGAIASLTTVVQCCSYSIGQAAQPILSANFGAGKMERVRKVLKYGIVTAVVFGAFWMAVTLTLPTTIIRLFMDATEGVLAIAPAILRKYGIGYLFAPFTLFATYYFQSILKARAAMGISLARGLIVGGVMLYLLPALFGADSLWLAMPVAEISVAAVTGMLMARFTKGLDARD